jgi:2-C-methyl-D-erythritol 2,4-cyclodiphosphate synthase
LSPSDPELEGIQIGHGFDVHRFSDEPGRPLVLGGVEVEYSKGLHGHSDADVVVHCITDALLGAAGLGDMGEHFPDTDPRWKGARSTDLLRMVVSMVREANLCPMSADCTIVCERPRLSGYTKQMAEVLSGVVGVRVGVKVKSAEGLGAIGREEGIACFGVVLLGPRATGG